MTSIAYGKKYSRGMDVKEIAALVRGEIKAAVKSGELPKALKASVRIDRYSGGRSIDVKLTCPGLKVYSVPRLLADRDEPNVYSGLNWMSDEASEVTKKVKAMLDAYNFDGSDTMTDYFHVNFYSEVVLDGNRDEELAALSGLVKGTTEYDRAKYPKEWAAFEAREAEKAKAAAAPSNVVSLDAYVMTKAVEAAAKNGIMPIAGPESDPEPKPEAAPEAPAAEDKPKPKWEGPGKVPAVKITLTRAEGYAAECVTVVLEGPELWTRANGTLHGWSYTAPKSGGYNKCDFKVEYADGETYEGRYDLKHFTLEMPSLARHMVGFLEVASLRVKPGNMSAEDWERYAKVSRARDSEHAEAYGKFLDSYEIGG